MPNPYFTHICKRRVRVSASSVYCYGRKIKSRRVIYYGRNNITFAVKRFRWFETRPTFLIVTFSVFKLEPPKTCFVFVRRKNHITRTNRSCCQNNSSESKKKNLLFCLTARVGSIRFLYRLCWCPRLVVIIKNPSLTAAAKCV